MKKSVLIMGLVFGLLAGGGIALLLQARAGSGEKPLDTDVHSGNTDVASPARGTEQGAAGVPPQHLRVTSEYPKTDPTREDYDAQAAFLLGIRPADIYEREQRMDGWAAPMEKRFGLILGQDFGALFDGQVRSVECHQSSCRVVIDLPASAKDEAHRFIQVLPIGAITTPSSSVDGDTATLEAVVVLSRESRGLDEHLDSYRSFRREQIPRMLEEGLINDEQAALLGQTVIE